MKFMKKNNLLKTLFITFLIIVLLSCFVKPSVLSGSKIAISDINSIGFIGISQVLYSAISSKLDVLVLIVMVGIMYGVLNKTDAYQQLVASISKKFKGKEKWLIVISILFFALISSLFGLQLELFVFIPLFGTVLMYSGYDNKTVFASTIGSILLGSLAATFNTSVIGAINNYYGLSYVDLIVPKAFILVMSMYLFISHVFKKSTLENADIEYLDIPNYDAITSTQRKKLPIVIYIMVLFLLIIFGVFKFGDIIGIEFFANVNETLASIPVISNIFGTMPVFSKLGYIDLAYLLFICSLLIGFIYGISFNDMLDGMYKGGKRVLPAAIVLLFVSSISVITSNYSFYLTFVNWILSLFGSFNIFISTVAIIVASIFVPNITTVATNLLPAINATATSDINVVSLIVQTVYGLVMLVAPTSAMLMFGLSYYKIGYTEWLKYIVKLFLYILVILMAIFIIVVLI